VGIYIASPGPVRVFTVYAVAQDGSSTRAEEVHALRPHVAALGLAQAGRLPHGAVIFVQSGAEVWRFRVVVSVEKLK
jgi:hypothetical protein